MLVEVLFGVLCVNYLEEVVWVDWLWYWMWWDCGFGVGLWEFG